MAAALFCWFLADLLYLLGGQTPGAVTRWVNAGWLIAGVFFAVGIWRRPRRVIPHLRGGGRPLTVARIGLALVPVLVPASVAVVAHALGTPVDPLPGFVANSSGPT